MEHVGARNFTILPVAASNRRSDCAFSLNYGSSLIGVGSDSNVAGKPGHQKQPTVSQLSSPAQAPISSPPLISAETISRLTIATM